MGRHIIAVAICFWLVASFNPTSPVEALPVKAQPQSSPSPSDAAKLLEESYAAGSKLDDTDRIQFLNDLIIIAPDVVGSEVVKQWTKELVDLINAKPQAIPAWSRVAFMKNVAVALSKVDPAMAMDVFSSIGALELTATERRLPEDVRAFGARTLFPNYFKAFGPGSLPTLEKEGIRLYTTGGSFPFHAMSLILPQLPESGKDGQAAADNLFAIALEYYRCDSKAENQHLEFFTLLQSAKAVVSKTLLVKAVHQFADHLKDPNCDQRPNNDGYLALIQTTETTVEIHEESRALLFRAFGLIKDIDRDFATKLKQNKNLPELAGADAPINQITTTFIPKNATPEKQTELKNLGLQQSLMRGIASIRDANPQAALQMSRAIEEPASRVAAVASILPSLTQSDVQQAQQLYLQELDELNSLPGNPDKLETEYSMAQAILWMAQAAYQSGDFDTCQYLATKTFDDGVAKFEADYARNSDSINRSADSRPGYLELAELLQFAGAHNVTWLITQARQVPDARLRAHLMMHAAKGLSRHTT